MDTPLAQKLSSYTPDANAQKLIQETPILLLVGPTGAGKDSLKDLLLQSGQYHHIVSHTTRRPRINHGILEVDGQDYHFIDKPTAERMLEDHAFIEAKVYSDNLYGTSVAEIQVAHDDGKVAMTDIEVQGVAEYKQLDPNVMAVFILPPDFASWQERLQRRYGDVVDAEDARLRMETARRELQQLLATDYYVPVINDDLETAFEQIKAIINAPNHRAPDETQAHAVAEQLEADITAYLAKA